MRKFRGYIGTNQVGSDVYFEFEVPDNATDEEIEEVARDEAFNWVDWHFTEVKNDAERE